MSEKRVGQAIAAGLLAAAAGGLAWGWRRHGRHGHGGREGGNDGVEHRTCACGQAFRVVGSGRHQVFWTAGAPRDEAVLSGRCPACDRPLPA